MEDGLGPQSSVASGNGLGRRLRYGRFHPFCGMPPKVLYVVLTKLTVPGLHSENVVVQHDMADPMQGRVGECWVCFPLWRKTNRCPQLRSRNVDMSENDELKILTARCSKKMDNAPYSAHIEGNVHSSSVTRLPAFKATRGSRLRKLVALSGTSLFCFDHTGSRSCRDSA